MQEVGPSLFFALLVITVSFLPIFALEGDRGAPLPAARLHQDLRDGLRRAALGDAHAGPRGAPDPRPDPRRGRAPAGPAPGAASTRRCVRAVGAPPLARGGRGAGRCSPRRVPRLPRASAASSCRPSTRARSSTCRRRRRASGRPRPAACSSAWTASSRAVPEVARVFGKAGRAESPTDMAPLSMIETLITLRPRSEWRAGPDARRAGARARRARPAGRASRTSSGCRSRPAPRCSRRGSAASSA